MGLDGDITWPENLKLLSAFVSKNPAAKFLRLQYLDLCGILRVRLIPVKRAQEIYKRGSFTHIPKGPLVLLPNDIPSPEFSPLGEYILYPDFRSIRLGGRQGYVTVQCDMRELDLDEVERCPRTTLKRATKTAKKQGIDFLVGFEIEVMFLKASTDEDGELVYDVPQPKSQSHGYSSASALHDQSTMHMVEDILSHLEASGIGVEQWHAEGAVSQFEFDLSPQAPIHAVDTLLAARDIIMTIANVYGLRATLHPKPFPDRLGSGAHIHFSMTPPHLVNQMVAGMLKHMSAIMAFTYSKPASYERICDSMLAGSRWICWGTRNREVTLRLVEGSHYELRCADGFANMYLAVAALLCAGTLGVIDDEILMHKDCQEDPANLGVQGRSELGIRNQLPTSFALALGQLREDSELQSALGQGIADCYWSVKQGEGRLLEGMNPGQRRNLLVERY